MNEHAAVAKQAAKEAIAEHYQVLGYDITDPEERRRLQADFAYTRRSREGSEEVGKLIRRSAITLGFGGIVWMLWEGFKIALTAKVGG